MREQRLHGGVEPVALLELHREAFAQVARTDAGGVEGLHDRQHRLDLGDRRAEPVGNGGKIGGEIAGFIDRIDQVAADHAPRRIGDGERKLLAQMIGQRRLGGDEGLEIVVAVLAAAGADARPFRIGGGLVLRRTDRRFGGIRENVLDAGIETVLDRRRAIHVGGLARSLRGGFLALIGLARPLAGALQQRIALQFAFHIGGQIEIRELQQLDGLHQLRRHHQSLALAEFESLRKRHVALQYWSGSCFNAFARACTPDTCKSCPRC